MTPKPDSSKPMPDIDSLMQEWPSQVEDMFKDTGIPTADFDCDVSSYVDVICALLDIPVHKSRIQARDELPLITKNAHAHARARALPLKITYGQTNI